jgi:hypothetical protein
MIRIEWRIGGEWGMFAEVQCNVHQAIAIIWVQMKCTEEGDSLASAHNWHYSEIKDAK